MTTLIFRREGHDPQNPPSDPEGPNPNDPIESPKGADPGPNAEPTWTPERESEPVLQN
jgi:hypothetical protein